MKQQDLFNGQTILVTGASSGLGAVFARRLAARGAHLILTARREERLHDLARELSSAHGVRVQAIGHDLEHPGAARSLFDKVQASGTAVDVLINNAGFGLYDDFGSVDPERYEAMIRLNVEALTLLARLFVPSMRARGQGGIINVASTAGFQPVPGFTVYSATKAYVITFTEALAVEMRGTGVRVLLLCPGSTKTGFQSISGTAGMSPAWLYEAPETVVDRGLRAFEAGQTIKVSGAVNWTMAFAGRFFPRGLVAATAGMAMSRAKTMLATRKSDGQGGHEEG